MLLDLISTSMDKNVLLQIDIYHASHKLRSDSLISTACFVSLNGCELLFFRNARCQKAVFTMLPVTLPTSLFLVHLNLKHMFIVALRGEKTALALYYKNQNIPGQSSAKFRLFVA